MTLQGRVIGALVLRETRATFGTTQLGYLWAIVTPAAGIAVLVIVFTIWGRQAPFGSSLALFFATGILTLEFFRKLSSSLMSTLSANQALLTYPLIKETDTLYARFLLISATYLLIMVIFYMTLIMLGLAQYPTSPQELILAFSATALFGFGFGVLNAVIISLWESWKQVEMILTRPLFFLSGIFFIPSHLPAEAINILKWNPMLHLVEWIRVGFYPNYESSVLNKAYPLGVAMVLILLGLAGERLYRNKRV